MKGGGGGGAGGEEGEGGEGEEGGSPLSDGLAYQPGASSEPKKAGGAQDGDQREGRPESGALVLRGVTEAASQARQPAPHLLQRADVAAAIPSPPGGRRTAEPPTLLAAASCSIRIRLR